MGTMTASGCSASVRGDGPVAVALHGRPGAATGGAVALDLRREAGVGDVELILERPQTRLDVLDIAFEGGAIHPHA